MLASTSLFLIVTLCNLYIYVVLLRLVLQAARARYENPLSQFALRLTQPAVKPLQKIFPEIRRIDLAIVALALLVELVKYSLVIAVTLSKFPNLPGLLILSVGDLFGMTCRFYFYLIIIRVVLSWLTSTHHNLFFFLLLQLTEPVLYPIRRIVPPLAGFDLSPLIALIVLQILEMLVADSLMRWGSLML